MCVMCGWAGGRAAVAWGGSVWLWQRAAEFVFSVICGASRYAPGSVSGAALEPGIQPGVLTQKLMLRRVHFTDFFPPTHAGW